MITDSHLTHYEAVISHIEELQAPLTNRDVSICIQLPTDSFLASADSDLKLLQQQCTYSIPLASQALHHASGLLSIMSIPLIRHCQEFDTISAFQEHTPWLFDAYLRLHETQVRWQYMFPTLLPLFLRNMLQLLSVFEITDSIDICIRQKASTLLVLLCIETSGQPLGRVLNDGQENSDYQLLCMSLLKVAKACKHSKPISRLVASQLVPALEKSIVGNEAVIVGTDLGVCVNTRARGGDH